MDSADPVPGFSSACSASRPLFYGRRRSGGWISPRLRSSNRPRRHSRRGGWITRLGAANPALVPGIVGTLVCADLLVQSLTGPYPGARLGGILGIILVGALADGWMCEMHATSPPKPRVA